MKRKCINTLVAAVMILGLTTNSALPAFAEPENDSYTATDENSSNDAVSDESTVDEESEGNETSSGEDNTSGLSIEDIVQNIQDYDSKIEYKMDKLNELKEQILEKENDIKENEDQIELAEENIEDKDIALSERMKQIQINGGLEVNTMKYIDALISSGDLLEAVQKVRLISQICTTDKKLVLEAKEAKDNLTEIKDKIEKEKDELEKSKQVLEIEIKKLEDDKTKLLDYIKENSELLDLSTSNIVPVTLPSDMTEKAKAVIEEAQKYLGIPYLWGGTTPEGFDCSGLMQYVFASQGMNIPRVSQDQQKFATKISIAEIKPGDLVFNKSTDSTHVGMYIGNDMYLHAPHTGDVVKISQLSTSNMKYAGRIIEAEESKEDTGEENNNQQ